MKKKKLKKPPKLSRKLDIRFDAFLILNIYFRHLYEHLTTSLFLLLVFDGEYWFQLDSFDHALSQLRWSKKGQLVQMDPWSNGNQCRMWFPCPEFNSKRVPKITWCWAWPSQLYQSLSGLLLRLANTLGLLSLVYT